MLAVVSHGLDGNDARARYWAETGRARAGGLSRDDFLRAFPFRSAQARTHATETLRRYGF
jgi:hypothetical protein